MPAVIPRLVLAALLTAAATGCPSPTEPTPSGATCPPGNTLTYDGFGRAFMTSYCTRCHASTLDGPDRHGAPLFHDFDSLRGILNVGHHVDEYAAAGPLAVNTLMPYDGARPTLLERQQLGTWLACEFDPLANPDAGLDAPPGLDAGLDAAPGLCPAETHQGARCGAP